MTRRLAGVAAVLIDWGHDVGGVQLLDGAGESGR